MALGGITAHVVEFAMDGLSLRHQAIASNIANVNSSAYRPINVSFESKIADMLANQSSSASTSFDTKADITYGSPAFSSTKLSLEMNTVMLNQNVLQYQALIKGLDKYEGAIAIAINEGRR